MWTAPGRALGGQSDVPILENGQPPCILPSDPYAIPAKLKNAAINERRTSGAMIFLNTNDICFIYYIFLAFKRSELPTTDRLENAIAAPAKIGFSRIPKNG